MRIDAHHHVWSLARGDYGWLTPEAGVLYRDFDADELRPMLDIARIDGTILVQAAPTEAETFFLLDVAGRTPWIRGVVGWTDLAAPDAPEAITRLARQPALAGLRPMLQDLDDPEWILGADVDAGLRAMAEHGLVFDALVRSAQLPVVAELARRHPDLAIVIDHGGKPAIDAGIGDAWVRAIDAAAAYPQVAIKLSGLVTESARGAIAADIAPFFEAMLEAFGAGRMLWGSDWPVITTTSDYHSWVATTGLLLSALSAADTAAIWGKTAARIYRIDERN